MTLLTVKWNSFEVIKKHDIDRDKPYLWVFGIVVDTTSLLSKDYVIRRPAGSDNLDHRFKKGDVEAVPTNLDISRDVKPLAGLAAAGVVVVAWENAMTRDSVIIDAYNAAADTINEFVTASVADLDVEPTDAEMGKLEADVEAAVRDTIKQGWSVFQLVPDHNIGTAFTFLSLEQADFRQHLTYRFVKGSTEYELLGDLTYGNPSSGRPVEPGDIPIKHQSTKPTATLRPGR